MRYRPHIRAGEIRETIMLRSMSWMLWSLLLVAVPAVADSWMPARIETSVSPDGMWRLTVHPRELSSNLDYFEDLTQERPQPGGRPDSTQTHALGHMEHQTNGQWRTVWRKPLENDVAPVNVVVADDGHVVTFDNWHSTGYGPHVVVIYDPSGNRVRALSLLDFLPEHYIEVLPHSVSSIRWRGTPRISEDGSQAIVPVIVPYVAESESDSDDEQRYVDVRFVLRTGQLRSGEDASWIEAVASAHRAARAAEEAQARALANFIAPLQAPQGPGTSAWYRYLEEAHARLEASETYIFPGITVVASPDSEDWPASIERLRDRFRHAPGHVMIGSPSQTGLVSALTTEAARVEPGALFNVRVYVAVDRDHMAAVETALAPTGATYVPIDIGQAIAQRPERLERYLKDREADKP
jgi:hypothetical protein